MLEASAPSSGAPLTGFKIGPSGILSISSLTISMEEKEALAKKEAEKAARIKAAKEAKAAKAAAAKGPNA